MLNLNGKVIERSQPHEIRYFWKDVLNKAGVYEVVYPPNIKDSYQGARFVSMGEGSVIYVSNLLAKLIPIPNGWEKDHCEFEKVDADVSITVTEK
jgi:hypothetical protein